MDNRASSQPSITIHHHNHSSDCADNSEEKDNLFPAKISKKEKYGYEVEWADGATIIYSLFWQLQKQLEESQLRVDMSEVGVCKADKSNKSITTFKRISC